MNTKKLLISFLAFFLAVALISNVYAGDKKKPEKVKGKIITNLEKNYVLIFSDLSYKEQTRIKKILIGSLRLSIKGNHQGYLYL